MAEAEADGILQRDVPCTRCGYDLRGLPSGGGRCPECGLSVDGSVLAWIERRDARLAILRTDSRWFRQLAEGALISLVALVLLVAVAAAPAWAFELKSPQRRVALGVACTMWVLSWAAAWKLSTREPGPGALRDRGRRALRVSATVYLAMPFLAGLTPRYNAGLEFLIPGLVCVGGGIIASVTWFVRAGALAARLGSRSLPIEARLLIFINALTVLFLLLVPTLDAPEDSLYQLASAPVVQFGSIVWLSETFGDLRQHLVPHPIELAAAALAFWSGSVSLRLLQLLRRAARLAKSGNMPATDADRAHDYLGAADPQAP